MRISEEQVELLKATITSRVPDAKIYLFGSRVDDRKRGGDIDILILGKEKLQTKDISFINRAFWERFGEQKLDLVSFTFDSDHPFKELVLLDALEL